ncbi:EAL domain-containing protein [Thiomicrorhabdus indica]|uniref:EAL domain-containing protein n=1 Tax=Thiomicrorhabdus indica TaxID=2267253 RepID=UPI00102DBC03|nr:EAL domain-containing protein [Thiomicrorhabdus indica]
MFLRAILNVLAFATTLTFATQATVAFAKEKIYLGFYAHQSKETIEQQYEPFFKYLSDSLPNHTIIPRILDAEHLKQAVRNNQINLLFINPNLYLELRHEMPLNGVIATVQRKHLGKELCCLGGVIFTRTKNSKINSLKDLEKSKVAVPSFSNTGAYRVPLYELHKNNINYENIDFIKVGDNDSVIEAVMSNQVDAGFIRTGILEQWSASNQLDIADIKVLNLQKQSKFPQILSTGLYPEWPFIIMPNLDDDLKRDIAVALFSLRIDHPAAIQANISGFIAPRDYKPLENLLIELRLPPYDVLPKLSLNELIDQNKYTFIGFSTLFLLVLVTLTLSERYRSRLKLHAARLKKQSEVDQILLQMPSSLDRMSEQEFLDDLCEKIEHLTNSTASFLNFVDEDKNIIYITGLSKGAREQNAHLQNTENEYSIDEAGVWAEAIRQKKVVCINDYPNYENKKGLPDGHMELHRLINLVVTEKNKTVLLAGITGKPTDYTNEDTNIVQIIANQAWQLIKDRRTQKEIESEQKKFNNLIHNLGDRYVVFSHNGQQGILNFISKNVFNLFGIHQQELINTPWFQTIQWKQESINLANQELKRLANMETTHSTFNMEFLHPKKGNRIIFIEQHGVFDDGKLISIDGFVTDITEENEQRKKLNQAALVFEKSNQGIIITDSNNRIVRVNERFQEITGYHSSEIIGKNPSFLGSGKQNGQFYKKLWEDLLKDDYWQGELWNRRKTGEFYIERLTISIIRNENGDIQQYLGLMSDITQERTHQELLEKRANFDDLTGLPNRTLLTDRVNQSLASAHRHNEYLAILFIDLDGFKEINDQFGHPAGDYLLQSLSQRFLSEVRNEDTVARIGGDEFVIVLNRNANEHDFGIIEKRLLSSASAGVPYQSHSLKVSCSIGSVHYHPDYDIDIGSERLIRLADQAMFQAKQKGKNQIFTHQWENNELKTALKKAFKKKEFHLYYQPKVDFNSEEHICFEGLIRWIDPDKGVISPAEFLPAITQSGLEIELGDYVLQKGLAFIEIMALQGINIHLSLNISGLYLQHHQFIEKLVVLLAAHPNISPSQITLELLESSALEDLSRISEQIMLSRNLGVKFAIDDFGTGHASLNYLKHLPVNELKIDQEFTRGLFEDPNNLSILEATKSMAEAFNLSVIVEGVETEEHIALLIKYGFSKLQGYGIARPMPENEVLEWIKNWTPSNKLKTISEVSSQEKETLKAEMMLLSHLNKIIHFIELPASDIENSSQESDSLFTTLMLTTNECPFGRWLDIHAHNILDDTTLEEVYSIHEELHALYLDIIESKTANNPQSMQEKINRMHHLKESLINKINHHFKNESIVIQ